MWCENGTEKRKSFVGFAIFPILTCQHSVTTEEHHAILR